MNFRERFVEYIHQLQDTICTGLEQADGKATFVEDRWERPEGGGGKTRVIADGNVLEKGGVNTSVVHGPLPASMQQMFGVADCDFFACGLSMVLHPLNPFVPTTHANWRYFELYNKNGDRIDSWFGGGADLTPYYLFEEDARHFHTTLKNAIAPFGEELYPLYKKQCDEYFANKHRNNEMRGIGGVFYDHLRPTDEADRERLFAFQQANGDCFLDAYLPIISKRKDMPYGTPEVEWQEIRRGRYVEFNLVHDKGTLFGLKTNGRTESILMSLPPRARWYYAHEPAPGSREAEMMKYYFPNDWVWV
ncbi:oxygen-dependent coproporphyrinogen oxidase [Nemorincola caseinilytica]|uniref:coproporphyrinogen oxidase n=1 Tax=Nemorincola caseinilytica TaxID=2054315 RepID=A0ABP8N5H2_9BACT